MDKVPTNTSAAGPEGAGGKTAHGQGMGWSPVTKRIL
jgi:hypothetical protein